ncbi:MAG TPA: hypothetical protein VGP93_20610, partial [Polyangiaceae bacterium]|nr:hypothetical protein [Polyangiaceae bacterium]
MIRRIALATLATWVLLSAELALVASAHWRRIASVWELSRGGVFLAPAALVPAALFGILGLLLIALLQGSRAASHRLVLAGLLGVFGSLVSFGVGGGRHLASLPVRGGFALGVGLVCSSAAWILARPARRTLAQRPLSAAFCALVL